MPKKNQPIQGNFGDIYRVETPHFDQALQQIQQNYTDRRNYLQKENQNTEELLNKEMANVRSVDTPAIIDAYNDYKNSKQNQLFNRSIQTNPKAYAVAQMDANSKYANLMSMINKSSQYNAFGKEIAANRFSKPDNYSDDAGSMLSTFYQTPMDKLTAVTYNGKPTDLTNPDNWRYQAGNVDLTKTYATAAGKPVTHYDNGTTDESGIQTTQHGYQYGNTPQQFRNTALTGLAGSQAARRARFDWANHSANQQQLDQLDAAYANSPNWQKLNIQPQQLPPYNPNDPIGNEATYQAKQYLVSMNPNEVKASVVTNQAAKMKQAFNYKELDEALKEQDREKLKGVAHAYKQMDVKEQSDVLDNLVGAMVDKAKSFPATYSAANGTVTKQYEIPASTILKKAFSVPDDKGHPIDVDAFRVSEDGQMVTPIFYKPGKSSATGVNKAVDVNVSRQMTMAEFKAAVGKAYFGVKEAAKEHGN